MVGALLEQLTNVWVFLSGISYVVVGIYLLRKDSVVSGRPEFYLGLAFLFDGFSYGIGDLPYVLDVEPFFEVLSYVGRISSGACSLALALFTGRVFRPTQRWARRLVGVVAALILGGLAVSAFEGDWEGLAPLSYKGSWLDWLGGIAPFFWLAIESSRQYLTTSRRVSLGLVDPLVRNRYSLIAAYATLGASVYFITIPMNIIYELHGTWSVWLDLGIGIAETAAILALWVSFSAPAFYRRWVGGANARISTER